MELALLLAAITYMVRGKFDKDTSQAAYKAGKEPPSVVKHRRKWEQGGGKVSPSGKPQGRGATRLALAHRWSLACEKAKERSDDKHRRWRAWFAEQAPQRDQKWREKQTNKIVKSEKRAEKFARARGILAHPIAARQEREAWDENARRDAAAQAGQAEGETNQKSQAQSDDKDKRMARWRDSLRNGKERMSAQAWNALPSDVQDELIAEAEACGGELIITGPDGKQRRLRQSTGQDSTPATVPASADPPASDYYEQIDSPPAEASEEASAAAVPAQSTGTTATTGGTVYQQAAAKLNNHADEIDGYGGALTQLSDDMGGVGWGSEVTEPLADMRTALEQVSTIYRDLAEQILTEGNRVNDAYDEAPWAPDKAALV